jgi:TonB family protein
LAWNFQGSAGERKLIRIFFIVSMVVHLLCLLVNVPRFFFRADQVVVEEEWAIEADVISDIAQAPKKAAATPDVPVETPAPEPEKLAAAPKAPPKLPDIAAAKQPPAAKEEVVPEPPKLEPPKPELPKPEPPKPVEEKKPEPEKLAKEAPKPTPADNSYKNELFEKLAREQKQSQDKSKHDLAREKKEAADLAKKIAKLKKSIGTGSDDEDAVGTADYRMVITHYIQKNYQIPEAYNYENAVPPVVGFSVTAAGELQGLKIIRSSNHAALDHFVLQSLKDAAQSFPKPPSDWIGRELNVRFLLAANK